MEIFIKESFIKIWNKDKVKWIGQIKIIIKGIGLTIKEMAKENL